MIVHHRFSDEELLIIANNAALELDLEQKETTASAATADDAHDDGHTEPVVSSKADGGGDASVEPQAEEIIEVIPPPATITPLGLDDETLPRMQVRLLQG